MALDRANKGWLARAGPGERLEPKLRRFAPSPTLDVRLEPKWLRN